MNVTKVNSTWRYFNQLPLDKIQYKIGHWKYLAFVRRGYFHPATCEQFGNIFYQVVQMTFPASTHEQNCWNNFYWKTVVSTNWMQKCARTARWAVCVHLKKQKTTKCELAENTARKITVKGLKGFNFVEAAKDFHLNVSSNMERSIGSPQKFGTSDRLLQ